MAVKKKTPRRKRTVTPKRKPTKKRSEISEALLPRMEPRCTCVDDVNEALSKDEATKGDLMVFTGRTMSGRVLPVIATIGSAAQRASVHPRRMLFAKHCPWCGVRIEA